MGPQYWLALGLGLAAALLLAGLGLGYRFGYAVGSAPVPLLEHRIDDLASHVAELLAQGEAGVAAAALVVEGERRRAGARASGDPRERVRVLLGDPPAAGGGAPDAPAGATA